MSVLKVDIGKFSAAGEHESVRTGTLMKLPVSGDHYVTRVLLR